MRFTNRDTVFLYGTSELEYGTICILLVSRKVVIAEFRKEFHFQTSRFVLEFENIWEVSLPGFC
jgi:hypothetical protein